MTELTACFLQFLSAIYTEAGSSQLDANTLGIITVLVTFALCMIAISNIIGIEKSSALFLHKYFKKRPLYYITKQTKSQAEL